MTPLPQHGEVLVDAADPTRTFRVSWHPADELFVLSIWHGTVCRGTFRLRRDQLPAFLGARVTPVSEPRNSPGATGRASA